ncbi:MAG: RluA family pseudouridine synthase [bacterium]
MKTIKIDTTEPTRLDKAVSDRLELSRSQIQKAIKSGQILVDGIPAKVSERVTAENKIEYDPKILKPKAKSKKKPPKLKIIYEDDDVIAINKPSGLLVHETETSTDPTLVDSLLEYNKSIASVGDDPKRAGIVHRLDKEVSGVMIAAKTQEAFEHLKQHFKDRKVEKHYTALVFGVMEDEHGTIDLPISRSKTHGGRMAARPTGQEGRKAVTHFEVTERFNHHTLLDVKIETGRTHQIRVHLFSQGYPIVGDKIYKQRGQKHAKIDRIFLHSRELTIKLPSGETKTFSAPIPAKLKDFLKTIK